jgi:outer membrane receptor protein involved in Fe transport
MDAASTSEFVGRCISVSFLILCLAMPAESSAQQDAPADEDQIEEIVVTGSRLLRRDFSAPSPIQTIDRETLQYSGQPTLEATLNKLPQITPDFDRTSNFPGNGTASVNLRGLGSERTLVMLNGRRLASAGMDSAVDVNSLPQALIERVEIITGGATTVYGSDAVAGVVNFVTRTDFDGFGLDMSAYATEEGDSTIYDINLTYGHAFASGRGNITLFGGYYDREPLSMDEREFTEVQWIADYEGGLFMGGDTAVPEGAIFTPKLDFGDGQGRVRTIFDPNGDPRAFITPDDLHNTAADQFLQVPLTRTSGGALFNYDLSDRVETYFELAHTRNEMQARLSPVRVVTFAQVNLDNPLLTPATQQHFADNLFVNPNDPNLVGARFGLRILDAGTRFWNNTIDNSRVVAGLRGDLTENWDFDVWAIYNKADTDFEALNYISSSRFQQGLLVDPLTGQCYDPSNGCVPVNIFGINNMSPEAVEFVKVRPLSAPTSRTQKSFSAFVRGNLFATWAGPIATSFGVELRSDEGSYVADELIVAGDVLGAFGRLAPIVGEETVSEVYVEAILPLAKDMAFADYLALELGARYSEYENAGAVDSWKLGFEWRPNQSVLVRGMYQRSVRAPNLAEAFEQQSSIIFPYVAASPDEDPCSVSSNPVATGNAERCVLTGLPASQIGTWEATVGIPTEFIRGGNPALTPEVAETFTFGAVFTLDALPNLQLSIDYFDLSVEDTIGDLNADVACFDPLNTAGEFCTQISRDPITYDIVEVYEPKINRGLLETSGIDTQVNWSTGMLSGDLVVDLVWTHMLENSFQETSYGTIFDCAGMFGRPCRSGSATTFPSDRIYANFNYASGNYTVFLNWRWISGTDNAAPFASGFLGFPDPDLAVPTVSAKNYLDLGFGYRFSDNIVARLSIANLTATSPAFMANASASAGNTDLSMYDLFGRSYTLSFSLEF